jgi:hypothetical protein
MEEVLHRCLSVTVPRRSQCIDSYSLMNELESIGKDLDEV